MGKTNIDLHIHSIHSSDGEFTPQTLVAKCREANIQIMAIADHNTVSGIDEGKRNAERAGIVCIPAMEIDCVFENVNLHVLGYGMDYANGEMSAIEENVLKQEKAKSIEKLELTNNLGFELTEDDLRAAAVGPIWTGELFAEILLSKDVYKNSKLLKPYRAGGERSDNPYVNFYWDFYAQGKPCFTKIEYPTLGDTVNLIHKHGGVAVLAHPGVNLRDGYELFDSMLTLGLDGVEAFSSYHAPEAIDYFYRRGKGKGLLVTCGSDFHGKTKPAIAIGASNCTVGQSAVEKQLRDYGLL
jgi:predicted metal-dependent phosphoesterase TrpH